MDDRIVLHFWARACVSTHPNPKRDNVRALTLSQAAAATLTLTLTGTTPAPQV